MKRALLICLVFVCVLLTVCACNNEELPREGNMMETWLLNDGKTEGDVIASALPNGANGEAKWGIWLNSDTFGKVLDFSTEGSSVRIKSTQVLLDSDFTVSVWVKAPIRDVRNRVILAYGRDNSMKLYLNYKNNYELTLEMDGMLIESSGAHLADGLWHHVVVTREGQEFTYYVDGEAVKTTTAQGAFIQTRNTDVYIGSDCDGDNSFDGSIAEVKFAKEVLKPGEISATVLKDTDNEKKETRLSLKKGVVIDRPQYSYTLIPQSYTEKQDIINCMNMGFDHVKLQLTPEWMMGEEGEFLEENMRYIDSIVEMVLELDYKAIVCVSPCASGIDYNFKTRYLGDLENFEYLCAWYEGLARHAQAKGWDPDHIAIQLMTEPYDNSSSVSWSWMSDRMYGAVRNILPDTTIITSANRSGNIEYLKKMSPATDDNLIYSFTTYEPYAVGWHSAYSSQIGNETFWNYIGDVPYPIIEGEDYTDEIEAALKDVPERYLAEARSALEAYVRGQCDGGTAYWMNYYDSLYNREWHFMRAESLNQWSEDNGGNIHIMVVEFGCYDTAYSADRFGSVGEGIPDSKRLMFVKDMREAWEAYDIGWCYWSYNEGFTVFTTDYHVNHVGGSPTAKEAALYADYDMLIDSLGLTPNMGYGSEAMDKGANGAWELKGTESDALKNQIAAGPDVLLSGAQVGADGTAFDGNDAAVIRNLLLNVKDQMTLSGWINTGSDGTILAAGQEWITDSKGKFYIRDFESYHQIWGSDIRPSKDNPAQGESCLMGKINGYGDIIFTFQPEMRDLSSYLSTENGVLHLSVFVSDPSKIVGGQLELTSSRGPDDYCELAWNIPTGELKKGWNQLTFRITNAIMNNTDLTDILCCRIYFNATDKAVVMVDDMYLTYDHRDEALEKWSLAIRGGDLVFSCGGTVKTVAEGVNLTDNAWHHVVLQADGDKLSVWIDGKEAGSVTVPGLNIRAEYTNLVIGADTAGGNGFTGLIRDVSVYDTALDPTAVWEAAK